MSLCLEQKSSLAGPEPPQLDTDDTLVDGPSSCISFSEESLLAEISRLREENRLLREELQRIKSVPMISVATQTGPSDPPSPLLLLQQDQRKQSRGAHSPLPIVGAQKVLLPPPFSSPSSLSLSGSPGTIQQAVSTEETADIVKKDGNNAGDDNGYDSDDNEKTFSITFNPPAKYREDSCPSLTLEFPGDSKFDDIVTKFWESTHIDLKDEIYYDQFKDVLLREKCAVSCALGLVEAKALAPLLYIARHWGADKALVRKLAVYEVRRCTRPDAVFSSNGLFRNVLNAGLAVYCKPFLEAAFRKAFETISSRVLSFSPSACMLQDEMQVRIANALDIFKSSIEEALPFVPEGMVSITRTFMQAARKKFPGLKQALFGGMTFCEIVCTVLKDPDKLGLYKGKYSAEISYCMKVVTEVFRTACCHSDAEPIADLKNDVIITHERIRRMFKAFVAKPKETREQDDEWFSEGEYLRQLCWVQTLLRTYPDKFRKCLSCFIQGEQSEDSNSGETAELDDDDSDDGLAFVESDTEIINNNNNDGGGGGDSNVPSASCDNDSDNSTEEKQSKNEESPDEKEKVEKPTNASEPQKEENPRACVAVEDSGLYKDATRLSFVPLHPRLNYHLKVHETDHYISEDPAFTGRPLQEWPLARLYREGALSLEVDFVDNKEFDDDQYVATQIARITGKEYRWSLLSDEAYLFSQVLYRAVPHVNRKYPINCARMETTPFPPQLERSFVVVVFLPRGEASKTCKCGLEMRAAELFATITAKFLRDTKTVYHPEEIVLKAVGKEQYLLHDDPHPISACSYIRDSLRRNKRPAFVIVPRSGLVLETPYDISFETAAPLSHNVVSSMSVCRPLNVFVRSATCIAAIASLISSDAANTPAASTAAVTATTTTAAAATATSAPPIPVGSAGDPHVVVECAVYYGGRRVSPLEATGLETLRDESGNYLWDNTVNLGMQIPTVPREARICFAVKVVDDSGKRTPLAWTSCGVFDHAGRLIAGPHSLPLLPGEPNPIGICVHAMGLQTNSQLKVVFQKDSSPTVPIVHFTCTPPDFTIATSAGNISSSSSSSSKTKAKISEVDKARLDELVGKDPLYVLSDEERTFVWKHRDYLRWVPLAIIKIAQSVPWVIPAAVQAMHGLLKEWPLIAPVRALELLDGKYPDGRLRAYAVRCLEQMGVDELDDYLMQLVQALKCETYHNSPLALFMLRKAVNHRLPLGHTLFLLLKAEMHIPEVRERFTLFLKCYLRASGQHRDVIIRQLDLIDALVAANRVKSFQALENFAFCGHFYLPHDPTLCVSRLIPEKCRVLGSARAPLWLAFENADKLSKEPVCVLFKAADDLRQDMLALQVIKLMGRFWEGDGLDMRLTVYKCVALGPAVGMIEVVPDCTTIADIQKLMGGGVTSAFKEKTIAEWLRKKNPSRAATATATAAGTLNDTVVSNFAHSLAGYCVATYLVGVGDRHNDNIMLKSDGRLFHIDFGHILGNVEKWNGIKRDRAPFVLTPEFVYVMGGKRSDGFAKFCDVACVAYNVIRKYSSTFITLFTMMLSTDIPELRSEEDIYYLKSAFNTEMDDEAAKECFRDLIMQSLGTKMTRINNAIHIAVHPHINDAHDANMD